MCAGHQLVRINLSEQTDVMDLLGADLPADSGNAGEFAWCDGPLLGALKAGHWVLLDELNLAGQSVLEGLNAMLDHRGEVHSFLQISQYAAGNASFIPQWSLERLLGYERRLVRPVHLGSHDRTAACQQGWQPCVEATR